MMSAGAWNRAVGGSGVVRRERVRRIAGRGIAVASLAAVVGAMLGFGGIAGFGVSPAAAEDGAAATASAVTVKWAGGNDAAVQKFQPDHAALTSDGNGTDNGSGHWTDFKDLEITVSKTADLREEAVVVSAKGMGASNLPTPGVASNFLQLMQCWGPNPNAPDFNQTCQYGAYSGAASSSGTVLGTALGTSVVSRAGESLFSDPSRFLAVTGDASVQTTVTGSGSTPVTITTDGTARFFGPSTSNEQPFVAIGSDGTARTGFEVQSALSQPYLGCGKAADIKGAGERCWLVVVPRGTHSNALAADKPCTTGGAFYPVPWGKQGWNGVQSGSPVDPSCAAWQDRIVVPLDFASTAPSCPPGAMERRVSGTELLATAFSSWQGALCGSGTGALSFNTNSGDLNRAQLLTGQSSMVVVSRALSAGTIGLADPALLDSATLRYAPVANTSLAFAFRWQPAAGDPVSSRDMKLTPRLLAKLMTMSYKFDVPAEAYLFPSDVDEYWPNRPLTVCEDPEWIALGNPTPNAQGECRGIFLVVGPQSDDATALLWQYLQSDADAAAFLKGEPDPWGNTINPYFLPSSDPRARDDGLGDGPDLSTRAMDRFIRADRTMAPDYSQLGEERKKEADGATYDAVSQVPFSESFAGNASRIFRSDSKRIDHWSTNRVTGGQVVPGWVVTDPGSGRFGYHSLGPADLGVAHRYELSLAQLGTPLAQRTDESTVASARGFVGPTLESMAAAVAAQRSDPATGVASADFGAFPKDGYPLTTTLYAAVNITQAKLDEAARSSYAGFLDYAAGAGQVPGTAPGQLPDSYVPLSDAQRQQAAAVAEQLRHPPAKDGGDGAAAAPAAARPAAAAPPAAAPVGNTPATQTGVAATGVTPASNTDAVSAASQTALGGTLVAGIAGLVASPFLLRRRGVG